MLTYALINFACFELAQSKTPGWRPSFTYFSWWTALLGTVLCVVAMFLTDEYYAMVSIIACICLYYYVQYLDPNVDWGSAIEAKKEMNIVKELLELHNHGTNVKNFRPNYIIFMKHLNKENTLVKFGNTLRYGYGMTVYGNIIIGDVNNRRQLRKFVMDHRDIPHIGYILEDEKKYNINNTKERKKLKLFNDDDQQGTLEDIELSVIGSNIDDETSSFDQDYDNTQDFDYNKKNSIFRNYLSYQF